MGGVTMDTLVKALNSSEGLSALKKVAAEAMPMAGTPDEAGIKAKGTPQDVAAKTQATAAIMGAKEQAAQVSGGQGLADQPTQNPEDAKVQAADKLMAAAGAVNQAASEMKYEEELNTTQTAAQAEVTEKAAALDLLNKIVATVKEGEKTAGRVEGEKTAEEKIAEESFYRGKFMARGFIKGLKELGGE